MLFSEEPVTILEKSCFSTDTALLALSAVEFLLAGAGGRGVL